MSKPKLSVLLNEAEEARFCAYCAEKGYKKSTLIARLVREHLDREGFGEPTAVPETQKKHWQQPAMNLSPKGA